MIRALASAALLVSVFGGLLGITLLLARVVIDEPALARAEAGVPAAA